MFYKLIFYKKDRCGMRNKIFICNFAHLNIYVVFEYLYAHEEIFFCCPCRHFTLYQLR